jgi:hypothetical protein
MNKPTKEQMLELGDGVARAFNKVLDYEFLRTKPSTNVMSELLEKSLIEEFEKLPKEVIYQGFIDVLKPDIARALLRKML